MSITQTKPKFHVGQRVITRRGLREGTIMWMCLGQHGGWRYMVMSPSERHGGEDGLLLGEECLDPLDREEKEQS